MTSNLPRFKAAACHTASIFLNAQKTADKVCDLIAEAAHNGASLIAFPEGCIPGFPVWAALQAPIMSHDFFKALSAQAIRLDGPELAKIRMAAKRHGVVVSVGVTEGTVASLGCMWNSNLLIGEDGAILNHHRKLVPTFYEKLVWAPGDGRGLRVVETPVGRVGMLICGENTNPLARYGLAPASGGVDASTAQPNYERVDSLLLEGRIHQTWQEAVERDLVVSGLALEELTARPATRDFSLPASNFCEPLTDAAGAAIGRLIRRQHEVTGVVTLSAERLADDLFKLRVMIHNATSLAAAALASRDETLLSTFISTHAILRVAGGEFVSLLEPPDELRTAAAACRNVGAWPVLAGEPGERDRLLASPIILYDYPEVAPESAGDWCDGAEIDEMLMLRVMTLTGDEKLAMRDVDRRAREILERTESMSEDQMLKLHGAFRGLERGDARPLGEEGLP